MRPPNLDRENVVKHAKLGQKRDSVKLSIKGKLNQTFVLNYDKDWDRTLSSTEGDIVRMFI